MDPGRAKKKPPASQKPEVVISSTKPQIDEIYISKDLVGSIIEKGFSSSSSPSNLPKAAIVSFPQPTVLPFPVARHRSHGPHWNPLHAAAELREEDDKDETDYTPISSFASPIERKEKKDLDFSQWRNFVSRSEPSVSKPSVEKKKMSTASFSPRPDEAFEELVQGSSEPAVSVKRVKPSIEVSSKTGKSELQFSHGNGVELASGATEKLSNSGRETQKLMPNFQGFGPTREDIHTENLTRLNLMSPEEIADAQTEIIEKMNPETIEMLKRRGREKLGNRKVAASGQEMGGEDMASDHLIERNKDSGNRKDNFGSEPPSQGVKTFGMAAVNESWVSDQQVHGNIWKIWSERVEKVRELRFTLEGDVLQDDSHQVYSDCKHEDEVGNVAERDILRTDGDPASLGYTIKEAIELIRSMVSAQRALALRLLDSILNKALVNLLNGKCWLDSTKDITSNYVDWQAIWAYALGPEPQLVLSLRIALDDNHHSVVLACAKVIQCMLSCDMNENFFNVAEKIPTVHEVLCTAPIFRSRTEIDSSFLQGGFWKYSTKPSNILPSNVDIDDEGEEQCTIQDDIIVAGQDIAAGFVRMGVLPRICYLLEMEPIPALVECLLSVLIGLARHSPTCANAIFQCPRLIQNIVDILTRQGMMELLCQIKAISILKVLSQMDKRLCSNFVKKGVFQQVMWHWYRNLHTIDQWMESGKERCKLSCALMVEQLRLWKACINHGYCMAYFADFFPSMCLWLNRPAFHKLLEFDVLDEFAHVAREAYITLGSLAKHLPYLYSMDQLIAQDMKLGDDVVESWSWSHVVPMVELAISWLSLNDIPYISSISLSYKEKGIYNSSASSMIWVISAVLYMLGCVFDRMSPTTDNDVQNSTNLPWLPEFVPKVGIEIVKNQFLSITGLSDISPEGSEGASLVSILCHLRHQDEFDLALSSLSCLHGLFKLVSSVDKCIQSARNACEIQLVVASSFDMEGRILAEGMMKWARKDLVQVLDAFGNLVSSEWQIVQSLETFGRGGPAPGVGIGWGSPFGGFWSLNILLAQEDNRLVMGLFKIFLIAHESDPTSAEDSNISFDQSLNPMNLDILRINFVLSACLVAGPGGRVIVEEALNILFQPSVLKHLGLFLRHTRKIGEKMKSFKWQYEDKDYFLFSEILNSHFRERWLSIKLKSSGDLDEHHRNDGFSRKNAVLETIHESQENQEIPEFSFKDNCSSFCIQWAYQRLPLPTHWFLSAICSIGELKTSGINSSDEIEVAKSGLFFLLCLETMSSFLFDDKDSPILNVPLVWKLHALSMSLHANMAVLEVESARNVFELLQEMYGVRLDELRHKEKQELRDSSSNFLVTRCNSSEKLLSFQSQINEGYTTFVENLVEQFGAISYGDVVFGRQVAIYLHRSVDIPVRIATWNALSNSHLLELLPPLEMCFSEAEGYLEPPEDNEAILEAYAKSWTSGFLDKAFTRRSLSFSIALHHLYSFIFKCASPDELNLRSKLTKSLLRSCSHKNNNFGMLLSLVRYNLPEPLDPLYTNEINQRLELLFATCDGNSSLKAVVDSLKSAL